MYEGCCSTAVTAVQQERYVLPFKKRSSTGYASYSTTVGNVYHSMLSCGDFRAGGEPVGMWCAVLRRNLSQNVEDNMIDQTFNINGRQPVTLDPPLARIYTPGGQHSFSRCIVSPTALSPCYVWRATSKRNAYPLAWRCSVCE